MTETPPPSTPAGWYPDPAGSGQQRYWDGNAWSYLTDPNPKKQTLAVSFLKVIALGGGAVIAAHLLLNACERQPPQQNTHSQQQTPVVIDSR